MYKNKFDYCIIFRNEVDFLKLHIKSFEKYWGKLNQFSFHCVDRGSNDGSKEFIEDLSSIFLYQLSLYTQKGCPGFNVESPYGYDVAYAYDWVVRNCGQNDWIFITHSDIYYTQCILSTLMPLLENPLLGAIGDCQGGFFGIKRSAYLTTTVGFWPLQKVVLVNKDATQGVLRSYIDARGVSNNIHVHGIDVGELLLIQLQLLGWKYQPYYDQFKCTGNDRQFCHFGGGSGYYFIHDSSIETRNCYEQNKNEAIRVYNKLS